MTNYFYNMPCDLTDAIYIIATKTAYKETITQLVEDRKKLNIIKMTELMNYFDEFPEGRDDWTKEGREFYIKYEKMFYNIDQVLYFNGNAEHIVWMENWLEENDIKICSKTGHKVSRGWCEPITYQES